MKPFDLLKAPLEGRNLIEASAGTGKTYNIEGLFIRLVLELQLEIDQILVLTFTNAATEELKTRIRNKLVLAREGFAAGGSADPLIDSLIRACADQQAACVRLQEALVDFDQAAIFTIHGFCQRLIHENAFETHNLFDTELVSNQTHLVQEVVDDFWRQVFYAAPSEWIGFALDQVKGPGYFVRLLDKVKTPDLKLVPDVTDPPPLADLQPFRDALAALRKAWPSSREAVIQALMDPALNANMYGRMKASVNQPDMSERALKIIGLAEAMDHLALPQSTGFPLFANFENFTTAKLTRATKKKHATPEHDFFDLCDIVFSRSEQLQSAFEQSLIFQKTRLFDYAAAELRKRKNEKNIQYFDDLLLTVLNVLKSENANQLITGIRKRYRAALVDEFQDTDSVQYDILTRLFSDENSLLFMIGDPKQSIYSFRGADIFSYMKAARSTEAKFTLLKNWRSEPGLITAVNTLFAGVAHPFIFDGIPFEAGRPARSNLTEQFKDPPLRLWYLDAEPITGNAKPINKPAATRLVADAVGGEICRLISTSPGVEPGDIAVLVRTNDQTGRMNDLLTTRKVPSVLYTAANIFDSRESREIQRILTAVAHPADTSRIKAALATDILGVRAEELISGDFESQWWESQLSGFREYLQTWEENGFIRMFGLLLVREKVKNRLLNFSDGERRLTNVLHLIELLHRQSVEKNTGVGGLLKWLADQRDPLTPRLEENQLRLESDENAVKIVTIHKSKGLEYPIVFCPFGWEDSLQTGREFAFHDVADDFQLTFDLGSENRDQHLAQARNELLAENLRLLYVALTRAKQRCYLVWGHINRADTSALAYLLHGSNDPSDVDLTQDRTLILKNQLKAKTSTDRLEDLQRLAVRSQNSIEVTALPTGKAAQKGLSTGKQTGEPLFCRRFTQRIDRTWKISSFSSLVSAGAADVDLPDRDTPVGRPEPDPAASLADLEAQRRQTGISVFDFPRGARAGSFFHDIFEHYDFAAEASQPLEQLVGDKLQQYGYDAKWQKPVCKAVSTVLATSLHTDLSHFTLSSLTAADRINEMEFYFPLNPVTPAKIKRIFKKIGQRSRLENFPGRLDRLTFAPSRGFMKGYIDMVFSHQGHYYLIDWKSNHLGSTPDKYDPSALQATMEANYYVLQYHIYALALHQHLRYRQPDYRYEKHFGGIFYIFIRGVNQNVPAHGVFYDRPDPDLIHSLGHGLIPGYG